MRGQLYSFGMKNPTEVTTLSITEATAKALELEEYEEDLRSMALILARATGDDGRRYSLDEMMDLAGVTRAQFDAIPSDHPELDIGPDRTQN